MADAIGWLGTSGYQTITSERLKERRSPMADKYDELERLARAATKAPWFFNPNAGDDGELYSVTHRNQRNPGLDVAFTHVAHDAKFIAAANPAVVLDLIAELRRLKRALRDARDGFRLIGDSEVTASLFPETVVNAARDCANEIGAALKE